MKVNYGGFLVKGPILYVGLAILGSLILISGLLAASLRQQKDVELSRVKESLCKDRLSQVPNLLVSPHGNKLDSEDLLNLKTGSVVIIYDYPLPKEKWPGAYFEELYSVSNRGQISFNVTVLAVNSDSVTVQSDCFPVAFDVPFEHLYNLFVPAFHS